MENDAFEVEGEEYEAELENDSVRSSESEGKVSKQRSSLVIDRLHLVDAENTLPFDPSTLLSSVKSGFISSLFANVPPTIRFCTEHEQSTDTIVSLALHPSASL